MTKIKNFGTYGALCALLAFFILLLLNIFNTAPVYAARMKDGMRDRRGGRIGSGNFKRAAESLSPTDIKAFMGRDERAHFNLNFNMRVDPKRLRGFLRVLDENNNELNYNLEGSLPSRSIQLSVPMRRSASRRRLTVKIAAGLSSGEGLGLAKDYSASVVLDPVLMVMSLEGGENLIRAYFNFDVDPETVKNFISIEPKTNFEIESGWMNNMLFIRGDFKPRDRFIITMKRGLPSRTGLALKEDFKQALIMPDLDSEVALTASGTYLAAINDGLVPLELVNVKTLQVDLWRLYENNIPYVIRGEYNEFQKNLSQLVFSEEFNLTLPFNKREKRNLSLEELADGERGLFLLTVRDAEKDYWDEAEQIINLSDLGAVARVWDDGILIWANTLSSVKPVDDAEVIIYSDANQVLAVGKTDKQGIFIYDNEEPWGVDDNEQPSIAVISKGDDLTYVQLNRDLLSRETFDTAGRPWLKDGYDAIIFSPRDIYRTGEEINFKAVVRNYDISVPKAFPVLFIVRDSLGRKTNQETIKLNNSGSALFNLKLPANALTGVWSIELAVPGKEDEPITSMNFHVEDFAPPRIEVKINSNNKYLTQDDNFDADISAKWLFGVDGAGLNYKTYWAASAADFQPKNARWREYKFGDPDIKFARIDGTLNEGQLDNSGHVSESFTLEDEWEAASIINVTILAEVMEDGGRWVTSSVTRPYFPAPYLLGIAAVNDNFAARRDAEFKVIALDPDENLTDPGELTAALYRVRWNYNMVEVDGHRRWQSSEELLKISEKNFSLQGGTGSVIFKPEEWGNYLVRVSNEDDTTRAVYRFYADDPKYAGRGGSGLLDRIDLKTDKEFYKVGETAKIAIKAPFEGLLLLNIEGAKLLSRKIQKIDNAETTIDVPVTAEMTPNAWITAWLIRPVTGEDAGAWGAHRAIGLAKLKINLENYKINVDLNADLKTEPAKKFDVEIALKDNEGKPVKSADIAIALVDDAVLNLTRYKTPDLLNHFWGIKELNSQGYDIYDLLIPVESRANEILHPAGGAAMAALAANADVRRFKILSLFNGNLEANNEGVIKTQIDLPEFSGRGRLFVVAAAENKFGKSEQEVQIARNIVTEANMPRFAAPNDKFIAPITIFNNSERTQEVNISLETKGGLKLDEAQKIFKISPNSSAKWDVNVNTMRDENISALKINTSWNENGEIKEFSQKIELPLRTPWPAVTLSGSGIFENGENNIKIPLSDFVGEINGKLTLADTPAVDVTRAANYLLNYPYGCLEQTISAAWPFLILPDAIAEIDPLLINNDAVKAKTKSALARIQALQLYDGSFAMWPNVSAGSNWASIYAAHFLIEARDAGINYPEDMLEGVINWLRQYLASVTIYNNDNAVNERDDFTAKAYGVYVLALYGEKPLGWIEYLRENKNMMYPSGIIYLAGAQALIEGRSDALKNIELGNNITPEMRGSTFESQVRNTAILLSLWLEVDPQAQETTELALKLANMAKEGSWYGTQDNAAALIALARYNLLIGSGKNNLNAKLLLSDGQEIAQFKSGKAVNIDIKNIKNIKNNNLTLDVSGNGTGYYAWSISGMPEHMPNAERKGINIEQVWLDEHSGVIDITKPIKQGTIMNVLITLWPTLPVSNLAVTCMLPAGLEIENPRLGDDEENNNNSGSYGVVSDIRDDRIILFFDKLSGEKTYGFKVRAVTRGTFAMPPVSASGMYDPDVRFTGRAQLDLVIR